MQTAFGYKSVSGQCRLVRFGLVLVGVLAIFSIVVDLRTSAITSDDVAQQNAVASISARSPLVIDLPTNTYVLKLPLYGLVRFVGLSPDAAFATEVIVIDLLTFILAGAGGWIFTCIWRSHRGALVASLGWLASLGGTFMAALSNPNSRNLEIGLMLAGLGAVAWWYDNESQQLRARYWWAALVAAGVLGLLYYDDPYTLYLFGIPLGGYMAGRWLTRERDGKALVIASVIGLSILADWFWRWLFGALGIHAGQADTYFVTMTQLPHHVVLAGAALVSLYRANLFGQQIWSLTSFGLVLNFVIMIVTVAAPLFLLSGRVRTARWASYVLWQPLLVIAVFIGSSVPIDESSVRYLVILPFYSVLILTILFSQLTAGKARVVVGVAVGLAVILNIAAGWALEAGRQGITNSGNMQLVRLLEEAGVHKGYAGYWQAGVDQYLSKNNLTVIPVGCARSGGVGYYPTLINQQEWLLPATASFYLLDPTATRCTLGELDGWFGQPDRIIRGGDDQMALIYPYDIARRFFMSGRDGF